MARRGKHGLPPHVSPARDRHGKVRLRFRLGLFSTYLKASINTEEFWQEYQDALAGVRKAAGQIGVKRHKAGSVAAVVASYFLSPEFLGLSKAARATYRGILERFVAERGERPVRALERQHVKAILGKMADRPHAASNLLKLLRILLDFAIEIELVTVNVARGVKGFKAKLDGFKTWSEVAIKAFEAQHSLGTRPRPAMALLLYTGQRRGDVVKIGWQHVTGDKLAVVQGKTGKPLVLKMHPALLEALAHTKRENMTFLVTAQGAPFSAAGFGNWFRECCNEAGLVDLSAHGLRKAAARRLAEAGNSANRIASVTGHDSLKEVERYTRAADQEMLAGEAIATMPDRSDREQNNPNLSERLDNNARKELK